MEKKSGATTQLNELGTHSSRVVKILQHQKFKFSYLFIRWYKQSECRQVQVSSIHSLVFFFHFAIPNLDLEPLFLNPWNIFDSHIAHILNFVISKILEKWGKNFNNVSSSQLFNLQPWIFSFIILVSTSKFHAIQIHFQFRFVVHD